MASTQIKRRIGTSIPATEDATKKKAKGDSEKDSDKSRRKSISSYAAPSPKKPKHENDARHFKFARKRAFSLTGGNGKYLPLHKRRKKEGIIPPTKFLLGGNIYDPLNLNSLQDEEINRAVNAVTPHSSPLPTPRHRKEEIQVLIPPNINDPLNLAAGEDGDNFELKLVSPKKRKGRRRRRHLAASPPGEGKEDQLQTPPSPPKSNVTSSPPTTAPNENIEILDSTPEGQEVDSNKESEESPKDKDRKLAGRKGGGTGAEERKAGGGNRKVSLDTKDKIVSPVVPQPGARKRPPSFARSASRVEAGGEGPPEGRSGGDVRRVGGKAPASQDHGGHLKRNFNKKSINYQYGNYNRYYGYRNPSHTDDNRLQYLRQELFEGKDVLDVGCNVGHVTLVVARDMGARSVIGMDIDKKLIEAARNNVRHYLGNLGPRNKHRSGNRHTTPIALKQEEKFPASMPILYGPIDAGYSHFSSKSSDVHKMEERKGFEFPHNVQFVQGNYVPDCDLLLETEQPKFDVILCLSVTKWIHLNWGDEGLKRAFRRMFLQLRPGGKLILEPQAWASYKKKKNITETISNNYHHITFFPQKFTQYLLSEVGFRKCEVLGMPQHPSKGFQRPIQLFYKEGASPRSDSGEGPPPPLLARGESEEQGGHCGAGGGASPPPSFQVSGRRLGGDEEEEAGACVDSDGGEGAPQTDAQGGSGGGVGGEGGVVVARQEEARQVLGDLPSPDVGNGLGDRGVAEESSEVVGLVEGRSARWPETAHGCTDSEGGGSSADVASELGSGGGADGSLLLIEETGGKSSVANEVKGHSKV